MPGLDVRQHFVPKHWVKCEQIHHCEDVIEGMGEAELRDRKQRWPHRGGYSIVCLAGSGLEAGVSQLPQSLTAARWWWDRT